MEYLWTSVSTQHLLVAVAEALQSYSITPTTGTRAADQTAEPAREEPSAQQDIDTTSTSGTASPSREAVDGSSEHGSAHEENPQAANGMFPGTNPTTVIQNSNLVFLLAGFESTPELSAFIKWWRKLKYSEDEHEGAYFKDDEGLYTAHAAKGTNSAGKRKLFPEGALKALTNELRDQLESTKAELAREPHPLTERMSGREAFIRQAEDFLDIYARAANDMTMAEFRVERNAALLRYLETFSFESLDGMKVPDRDGEMIRKALAYKKKTEKS
ncbi:hypothetical protein TCE0_043r15751 [Talaromyces pinophilus]|uniref:Uncharacterized protein n=1 Tax=Talaromyces pinophilus TaxID=128442 RepID=A0A0B8N1M3_TALPI|nr:hypothetical protein TCE0_043r15751 [Talaromyces pinophilus]